jgi:FAD/FMN-containing dehydrogenase
MSVGPIERLTSQPVHVHRGEESGENTASRSLVVAQAGCTTKDIIRKTMEVGLTVPLGARPGVGAGLWLQGGIGHLARLHGLTCDAIVGAVVVSIKDGKQVFWVGEVPSQHRPAGAIRPENEAEILWAIKGAGTNFGIVLSVTFQSLCGSYLPDLELHCRFQGLSRRPAEN